jgi:hypothetical protein
MIKMTRETKKESGWGKVVNTPKTDDGLLRRLDEAAKRGLTKNELHMQRVSFVFGNLPNDSTLTRQQVEAALAKSEGGSSAT